MFAKPPRQFRMWIEPAAQCVAEQADDRVDHPGQLDMGRGRWMGDKAETTINPVRQDIGVQGIASEETGFGHDTVDHVPAGATHFRGNDE